MHIGFRNADFHRTDSRHV